MLLNKLKVRALAFSPDLKYMATGDAYGIVKIWDALNNFAFIK